MSGATELQYTIRELKEENGAVWGRLEIRKPDDGTDLALEGALQELERRAAHYNLGKSEALNWMLGHPNLDEFFQMVVEHKKKALQ